MYTKLSLAYVAALAVASGAAREHKGHEQFHKHGARQFPGYSRGPLPSGLAPFSTGVVPSGAPYPTGSGAVPSSAPISTGGVPLTTAPPLTTGGSGTGSSPSSAGGSSEVEDTTLTYTIGTGSSTIVITTTIRRTLYQTNTAVSLDAGYRMVFELIFR